MTPKPGYWRSDSKSDHFFKCFYDKACLGGESPFNLLGNCEEGYQGNLCHHCSENFSRRFDRLCYECPEENWNLIIIATLGVVIMCVFTLMIKSGI